MPLGIPAPSTVSRRGRDLEKNLRLTRRWPSEPAVRRRGRRPRSSGRCGRPSSLVPTLRAVVLARPDAVGGSLAAQSLDGVFSAAACLDSSSTMAVASRNS